jgi:hypothetical protein
MITDDTKLLRCATGVIVSRLARDTSVLSLPTLTKFESGNLLVGIDRIGITGGSGFRGWRTGCSSSHYILTHCM